MKETTRAAWAAVETPVIVESLDVTHVSNVALLDILQ